MIAFQPYNPNPRDNFDMASDFDVNWENLLW